MVGKIKTYFRRDNYYNKNNIVILLSLKLYINYNMRFSALNIRIIFESSKFIFIKSINQQFLI